jgi:hypothetical protein
MNNRSEATCVICLGKMTMEKVLDVACPQIDEMLCRKHDRELFELLTEKGYCDYENKALAKLSGEKQ